MDKLTEQLEDWLPEFYEAKLVQGTRLVEETIEVYELHLTEDSLRTMKKR